MKYSQDVLADFKAVFHLSKIFSEFVSNLNVFCFYRVRANLLAKYSFAEEFAQVETGGGNRHV